jgi:hypothetical protein
MMKRPAVTTTPITAQSHKSVTVGALFRFAALKVMLPISHLVMG